MQTIRCAVDIKVTESGRNAPEYQLDSDLNGEITLQDLLEYTKSSLILIAHEVLKEEQDAGFDKNPVVAVDGRVGKPVENVSPLGSIEFTSKADINQMLIDTYVSLLDRSPVLTGRYKSSHFVFLNGTQVATDLSSLSNWLTSEPKFKDSDIIRFVDIQPYARKLERLGVTAQRTQSRSSRSQDKRGRSGAKVLVPNGTYYLTYRAVKRKYKRNSSIGFGYISGASLGLADRSQQHYFKTKRKSEKVSRTYLYPTIAISVDANGVANV